ncbi:dipeptidase [Inediibacterium massiliense]|uniref:dipeptidase n=1 Tax=Inediibacterium massiliense TaxID=1658111 RepID=UPI0006B4A0BC|nr:dipeptidase [Inediibacterium massiliense]
MRVIDLHCDTILRLMEDKESLELKRNLYSIDIEKLKKANSMAQFFALYIDLKGEGPLENALEMLDKFYIEMNKNKDSICIAKNYEELMKNEKEGKISAFLTIEEGGALKGKIHHLKNFYRLGVRLITLTWNYPNEIGYPSAGGVYQDQCLTKFGEEVVYEMNRLGMLIDVSHLSDGGFYHVSKLSKKPFIASHSNARSIKNHTRNLTDHMIQILANKGGVIGINFEKEFLGEGSMSKVEDMVAHIKHIKNIGGIDVLSIGTDFDGISDGLEISNMGEIHKLIHGLQKNNFSEEEIEKIFYKNSLRVIQEVLG